MSGDVTAGSNPVAVSRPGAALARTIARLAATEDHAGICRAVMRDPPEDPAPAVVAGVTHAALEARDEAAFAWALDHALRMKLPPLVRVRIGWRMARHQRPAEAFAVLSADPSLPDHPDCLLLLLGACAGISISAVAPDEVRRAAGALSRRCLKIEAGGWTASEFHYRPQTPSPRLMPAGGIALAPDAPGVAPQTMRRLLRARAAGLRRRDPASPIALYRDVLVDRWGRIWRRDGTVLQHDGPLAGRLQAPDIPDAPVVDVAILACGNTNNAYHWFGGTFPALAFRFEADGPQVPILIRDDARPFQGASLRLVGGPDVPILGVGDGVFVRELFVSAYRKGGALGLHQGGAARPLFDRMLDAAGPAEAGAAPRIYVSRRDATLRRPGKEEALEQVYIDRGFTPVLFRDMPLDARIRLMKGASAVAGPHGAGLTMLFACRPGTLVHEIIPWMPNTMPARLCMVAISAQFGLRHRVWVEPCDEAHATWTPHLGPLAADLDAFLAERR